MNEIHNSENQEYVEETSKQPTNTQSFLGIGLAALLATATFFSGLQIGTDAKLSANVFSFLSPTTKVDESVTLDEFWHVWNLLEDKYVDSSASTTVSKEDRIRGAISGLVRSYGDPYTTYLPPEQASMFEQDISGNFSGVGMEVGIQNDIITVIAPLPNSPAEKAGLMAGDSVIRINGESTEGMNTDQAVRLIRGEKGTDVTLTAFREGKDGFTDFTVTRDTITIPTSKTEIKDDAFVISLYSFNAISETEMQHALREYVKSGKKNIILDLRGNPGGYLQSAVSISSYFLPIGKTVVRESLSGNAGEKVYRSSGKDLGTHKPEKLVVLVDEGSASASEILAGALQEHGVATVIGAQTFGKGSVQELVKLDDGSSLKVTIARWLTPNGLSISEAGLTPNIVVERTAEHRMENIDPQMDAALEFIKK